MNLPPNVVKCVCLRNSNSHRLCFGDNGFQEEQVQVKFTVRKREKLKSIVLDNCLLTKKTKRCDGLFLFFQPNKNKIYILLIELKSVNYVEDAFEQLSYVKNESQEYKNLYKYIEKNKKRSCIIERCFIIVNGYIDAKKREKLQNSYNNIAEIIIPGGKGKGNAPDLREYVPSRKMT